MLCSSLITSTKYSILWRNGLQVWISFIIFGAVWSTDTIGQMELGCWFTPICQHIWILWTHLRCIKASHKNMLVSVIPSCLIYSSIFAIKCHSLSENAWKVVVVYMFAFQSSDSIWGILEKKIQQNLMFPAAHLFRVVVSKLGGMVLLPYLHVYLKPQTRTLLWIRIFTHILK